MSGLACLAFGLQDYGITKNTEIAGLDIKTVSEGRTRAENLRETDTTLGMAVENRVLTTLNAPAKHHIGMSFGVHRIVVHSDWVRTRVRPARGRGLLGGRLPRHVYIFTPLDDTLTWLDSLPINIERAVLRAIARFGLSTEQEVLATRHRGGRATYVDKPVVPDLRLRYGEDRRRSEADVRSIWKGVGRRERGGRCKYLQSDGEGSG